MTDFVDLNPGRKIRDEDGEVIHQPVFAPDVNVSAQSPVPATVTIHETLQVKNWKPTFNVPLQTLPLNVQDTTWVDEQILIQDIKAAPHWLQQAQKVADSFQPTWTKLKLCTACALNQVPEQYETCTTCNNAEFKGKPHWADELGRMHAL